MSKLSRNIYHPLIKNVLPFIMSNSKTRKSIFVILQESFNLSWQRESLIEEQLSPLNFSPIGQFVSHHVSFSEAVLKMDISQASVIPYLLDDVPHLPGSLNFSVDHLDCHHGIWFNQDVVVVVPATPFYSWESSFRFCIVIAILAVKFCICHDHVPFVISKYTTSSCSARVALGATIYI